MEYNGELIDIDLIHYWSYLAVYYQDKLLICKTHLSFFPLPGQIYQKITNEPNKHGESWIPNMRASQTGGDDYHWIIPAVALGLCHKNQRVHHDGFTYSNTILCNAYCKTLGLKSPTRIMIDIPQISQVGFWPLRHSQVAGVQSSRSWGLLALPFLQYPIGDIRLKRCLPLGEFQKL